MARKTKQKKDAAINSAKEKGITLGDLTTAERELLNNPNITPSELQKKFPFIESASLKKLKDISEQLQKKFSVLNLSSSINNLIPKIHSSEAKLLVQPRIDLLASIHNKKPENFFRLLKQEDLDFLYRNNKFTLLQWACITNGYKPLSKVPENITDSKINETYLLLQDAFSNGEFGRNYQNISFESALIPINKLVSWSTKVAQVVTKEIENYFLETKNKNKTHSSEIINFTGSHHSKKRARILKAALGAIFSHKDEVFTGKDILEIIHKENLHSESEIPYSERINTALINRWMKFLNEDNLWVKKNVTEIEKVFGVAISIIYNFKNKIFFNDVSRSAKYITKELDKKRNKIGLQLTADEIYDFIIGAMREAC